ncbi:MAG: hypothetical protein JXA67_09785, partial [Micromonosporaceae bacterium]|nr:hypothetical protein [Micromonosporaceae bacterium]
AGGLEPLAEGGGPVSISPVGSGVALTMGVVAGAGKIPDPQAQQAQVNAQADLLQAMQSAELPMEMVLSRLSDNQGVDLYM